MADIWLLSLLFLITFLVLTAFKRSKRQNHRKAPSPPGFPIIGNLHQIRELQYQSLWNLSKKYGPVMHLKLGKVPAVVLSSSDTARQALKDHDLDCCGRPSLAGTVSLTLTTRLKVLRCLLHGSCFTPQDQEISLTTVWTLISLLLMITGFSTKKVHSIQPIKDEEIKKLINSMAESASQNIPINLNEKFLNLTISVVCRAVFGVSFEDTVLSQHKLYKLIREAYMMLGSFSASDYIPYVGWIVDRFTGLKGRRDKSVQGLDEFYEQMFELHKVGKERGSEDFVDLLLRLEKEETVVGNDNLTKNHIKAILMVTIYINGPWILIFYNDIKILKSMVHANLPINFSEDLRGIAPCLHVELGGIVICD